MNLPIQNKSKISHGRVLPDFARKTSEAFRLPIALMHIGIFVLLLFFLLSFYFIIISEPIGDDILNHFDNGISLYLDDEPHDIGTRITTFSQVMYAFKHCYLKWSGRVIGYILMPMIGLIPPILRAAITAAVYVANTLLTLQIVYGSAKKALCHPTAITVLFLSLYWFRPPGGLARMWTMVSVYEIPLTLCLVYLYAYRKLEFKGPIQIALWTLFGLLVGSSHEVFCASLIAILGTAWLISVIRKEIPWTKLFLHTGLGIGYLICFFAPGNFHRMKQSHDATVYTMSLGERLRNSLSQHEKVILSDWHLLKELLFFMVLLSAVSIVAVFLRAGKRQFLAQYILPIVPFVAGSVVSVLVWGSVSYVPIYGMSLWICLFYMILLSLLEPEKLWESIGVLRLRSLSRLGSAIVAVCLCVLFFRGQYGWLRTYSEATLYRQLTIKNAVVAGQEEVIVPAYPIATSHPLIWLTNVNTQENFDSDYFKEYWGIHIIIDPATLP